MNWESLNNLLWTLLFLPLYLLCALRIARFVRPQTPRRRGLVRASPDAGGGLNAEQAASTALAATVGTGNIIGTAQALAMGGAGAVFWLWVSALLGCAVKYAEIYFGQGEAGGGAMGYIAAALGRRPARAYAFLAAGSALLVGNMAQINGTVGALCVNAGADSLWLRAGLGLLLLLLFALQTVGGAGQVGRVCERLVPLMSLAYVAVLSGALLLRSERLPAAFASIFRQALQPRAAAGAAGGAALRQTVLWGLRRGAFSNEAGLGTAANIHAGVCCADRRRHALWGPAEVLIDTVLLCTLTALTILCTGVPIPGGSLPGPELLREALAAVYGARSAYLFLAAALALFGWSTVLGCFVSGGSCAAWLGGRRGERLYRSLYGVSVLLGCVLPVGLIWQAADTVNVLMAAPNLLALLLLAPALRGKSAEKSGRKA